MEHSNARSERAARGYILQNQVTHARLLPAASKHCFVYPTLSLLLSLDALERQQLDLLRGWLFSYGGLWGRVTGLRPSAYLYDNPRDKRTVRQKLEHILDERGWPGAELRDAWLMTMPSFLGFEGINPLTVYLCYRQGNSNLWLVVLEIHNTFGERNVNVLETGKSEDFPLRLGFDHQWTFPRQFHVSPFNDRSGHYICQIVAPSHPPFAFDELETHTPAPPCPTVKITLLTAPPLAQTKLIAALRPTRSTPLTSASLLNALVRAPFALLLSFPRIVYQAFLLHYHKHLDVFQRPEPLAPDPALEGNLPAVSNPAQSTTDLVGGGIGWQSEGFLEAWCKRRVYTFLRKRCTETGVSVRFISSNPLEGQTILKPSGELASKTELTIYYRSPRLFTILFIMPSSEHALLFGSQAESVFSVSSKELFINTLSAPSSRSLRPLMSRTVAGRIRRSFVPTSLNLPLPRHHALDEPMGLVPVFVLSMLWFLATLEKRVFTIVGAKFVPGDEPWGGWERLRSGHSDSAASGGGVGSVRREP